jgi:UDP-N-acetyl-D-galactosamine dehydrogenase
LALICQRLELDTGDVLAAARTKWNFLPFTPGLVGGHCIGVDPYYLTHRAQKAGYHPEVVLAGRRVNDGMGRYVGRECVRLLTRLGRAKPRVGVLGVTFKEDVPDLGNSKVFDIIDEVRSFGFEVIAHDPCADAGQASAHGLTLSPLDELAQSDAIILAVPHTDLRAAGWALVSRLLKPGGGLVLDVRGVLDRAAAPASVTLWRL